MHTERKAFHRLEQQDLYELSWEAQKLSGAAERGELSRGQRTHRRRVHNVLQTRSSQKQLQQEKQIDRDHTPALSPQARYDSKYDVGQRARMEGKLWQTAGLQLEQLSDAFERRGFNDGWFGDTRKRVG